MRGGNNKENGQKKDKNDGRFRGRREWDNYGYRRSRPSTTKSGRTIKGRGKFRFRTPSRSRSRSGTPVHWKKEESRVIKLSEFEKLEMERKKRVEKQQSKEKLTEMDENSVSKQKEIDYNALDYEDNQTDDENDVPRKQVPSLVQYPLVNQQNVNKNNDSGEKNDENVLNKRSEVLAMALGVQIKSNEDEQTQNENAQQTGGKNNENLNERLCKLAGQENVQKVDDKRGRNKFETEKPLINDQRSNYRDDYRRRIDRTRRYERRNIRRPPPFRRTYYDRQRDRRLNHRSSRRSRSPPRRSRSRTRRSLTKSSSREKRHSKSRTKSPIVEKKRSKTPEKEPKLLDHDTEEKYKKLLLLKKKMELLELKKKKEEEQVRVTIFFF